MSNIWEVLLQSCTVTLCAVLLLIVKNALQDKLSPRWQYGVWAVLALRIVWPASMERTLLFNFPLWFEMLKTRFENGGSAYAEKYVPLEVQSGLPWVTAAPKSFADWLFIIYIVGIFVFLLRHLWSYMRLRALLRHGGEPKAELREAVERVCSRYGLRPCRVVTVAELPSAFVCGVFSPILAVPSGDAVDDKVLLHELLHLKYRDVLQNVLWCCLRALHWWNIFLVPVFERIGNELESLCDQRVLERLEGEERRDYGGILLGMASEKYARAAGTSSISNGGQFISERIEAIARFKKYPRGMALVSLCIAFVLAFGFLGGTVRDYQGTNFTLSAYTSNTADKIERSMAITRLVRCKTPDAAIDSYAKAMLHRNGFYLATASPMEEQEAIAEELEADKKPNYADVYIDSGPELEYVDYSGPAGYLISSCTENPDGTVDAVLQFEVSTLINSEGEELFCEYERDGGSYKDYTGAVILSVRAEETENGWVAYETAERRTVRRNELERVNMMYVEPGFEKTFRTPHGSITLRGIVNSSMTEFTSFPIFMSYDNRLHLDGKFTETLMIKAEYDLWDRSGEDWNPDDIRMDDWPGADVSVEIVPVWKEGDKPEFYYEEAMPTYMSISHSVQQENLFSYLSDGASWDGVYELYPEPYEVALAEAPWAYAVRLCWDTEIVEEIIFPLEEVLADD